MEDYLDDNNLKKDSGKLKIFFGYSAGVGKTYAMLDAAQNLSKKGVDVVVGYVEKHSRPETLKLLEGLEEIPTKSIEYRGITLKEFDLDKALKRHPSLILVDELAHSNAPGSRHAKRYQDVEELLKAGIDVYTTINVQHLESLNDLVESITHVAVSERIPDYVFDSADQVELVDIEPQDLILRLEAGKIYKKDQATRALGHFFTKDNLAALREISLRRTADRLSKFSQESNNEVTNKANDHILVCLSGSKTNAKVVRTAARMAETFHSSFTALYVEGPEEIDTDSDDYKMLQENIRLSEQLGARIVTLYGDDPAVQISEYAKASGITKIILGRTGQKQGFLFKSKNLVDKLSDISEDIDIYIIPNNKTTYKNKKAKTFKFNAIKTTDVLKSLMFLILSTLIGFGFYYVGIREANIITVYILCVLLTAIYTEGFIYGAVNSLLSVLAFNFFFTEPRFSLAAYAPDYPLTFFIMLMASVISSSLAARVEKQAAQSAQKAFSIEILMSSNQKLQRGKNEDEIIFIAARQLSTLLDRPIIYALADLDNNLLYKIYPSLIGRPIESIMSKEEQGVALWVLKNDKHAGATTNTLSSADNLYLSVRGNHRVMGVIGIPIKDYPPLESFEKNLTISILSECGVILETEQLKQEKHQIEIQTQRERLRANLLRAISHDLRTPLTGISGNAAMLLEKDINLTEDQKQEMYNSIYDDSLWLINLTENLLSVTKIDDGSIRLNKNVEIIDDLFQEALAHVDRRIADHNVKVNIKEEFLMANIDVKLIVQVIINLVNNAIKYTPKGSNIELRASKDKDMLRVSVSDDGPGISDENKAHIFDMFYRIDNGSSDNRRGLGLGLSLCKSVVEAHGGNIEVYDNIPHGCVFSFTVPLEEVNIKNV